MHWVSSPQPVPRFFCCWSKARDLGASALTLQLTTHFSLWINPIHFSLWINPILLLALSLLNFKKRKLDQLTEWLLSLASHACPRLLVTKLAAGWRDLQGQCGLGEQANFLFIFFFKTEKVILDFNLPGHRLERFTFCVAERKPKCVLDQWDGRSENQEEASHTPPG